MAGSLPEKQREGRHPVEAEELKPAPPDHLATVEAPPASTAKPDSDAAGGPLRLAYWRRFC